MHVIEVGKRETGSRKLLKSRYGDIPDALQMHGSDFDNLLMFLRLENSITSASCHAHYVQQLSAIDHVVV